MSNRVRASLLVGVGIIIGIAMTASWSAATSLAQTGGSGAGQPGCRTFAETGHTVCGKFLTYWDQHGGLAQQGFPISEEFVETSALNGKPYTVQYFERAVFELHPENQPPYDVLLSQLGTYVGKANYTQGFPANAGVVPYLSDQTDPVRALLSYYNAINRKEYDRAYGYFRGAPNPDPSLAPPYAEFVKGYANTVRVDVAVGKAFVGAGAGNLYASIPVALFAEQTGGAKQTFAGCYIMHRVNSGISPDPSDELWRINSAEITAAPAGASVDDLLARTCEPR